MSFNSGYLRTLPFLACFAGAYVSAQDISFNQVDWLNASGGFQSQNSNWGLANFDFDSGDLGSLFSDGAGGLYGYLNLAVTVSGGVTDGWAVQNHLVYFDNSLALVDRLSDTFTFNLGVSGAAAGSVTYVSSITAAPLISGPIGSSSGGSIATQSWLWGGEADTNFGGYVGEAGNFVPTSATNYVGEGAPAAANKGANAAIGTAEKNIAKVNEELNGCAPAAAARSLKYLGVGGNVQDIYDSLKSNTYMKTSLGATGSGTQIVNFLAGKRKYTTDNNLPITTTEEMNFATVVNALKNGADVEIGVYWGKNAQGQSMGGHCAFVSQIVTLKDANGASTGYEVKIIEDPTQGDGTAANSTRWLKFDTAGNMSGYGTGAALNSFRVEVVPEPATLSVLAIGLAAIVKRRMRK